MALKIIKAADTIRVDRLNVCIYGAPGVGKSTLAFTADAPLLLDFDRGAHRAAHRRDIVPVAAWSDVTDISADDLAPYRTVIVDTAGRALDVLTADIIRRNPKMGRGGALTLPGYGQLKSEFTAWLRSLNQYGLDVLLIAHMDEQRSGDEIVERLDVQGGSKGEVYKAADAMGRLLIREGKRWLNFSPTDAAFGKNPGQLEPLEVPHPDRDPAFLAGVIEGIKTKLNTLSDEQRAQAETVEKWREKIATLDGAQSFNEMLDDVKMAPKAAQALFADAARSKGHLFSKEDRRYVDQPEAAA